MQARKQRLKAFRKTDVLSVFLQNNTTSMLPQTELGLLFVPLLLFGETVTFPPFLALLPDHCLHGFQLAWQSPAGVIVERWTVSAFKAQKVV